MPRIDDLNTDCARLALRTYASRSSVMLVQDLPGEYPSDRCSGTLLRARSGRVVVLTVKHGLEGRRLPIQMISPLLGAKASPGAIECIVDGPSGIDVALAVVRRGLFQQLVPGCLPREVVTPVPRARYRKGYLVLVIGSPVQTTAQRTSHEQREEQMLCGSLGYWTNLAGSDNRNLSIEFAQGVPDDTAEPFREHHGFEPGVTFEFSKPSGLSGGAVFGFIPPENDEWSPDRVIRLIGIPHEFSTRRQLAVRIESFHAWLHEQLEHV